MRAIENDRWLLSATDTGVTAAIDPWGRVAARIPRKERAALVAPYALTSVTTFYTRYGDWFAFACAIILIGVLIERFAFANRKKADTSSCRRPASQELPVTLCQRRENSLSRQR